MTTTLTDAEKNAVLANAIAYKEAMLKEAGEQKIAEEAERIELALTRLAREGLNMVRKYHHVNATSYRTTRTGRSVLFLRHDTAIYNDCHWCHRLSPGNDLRCSD